MTAGNIKTSKNPVSRPWLVETPEAQVIDSVVRSKTELEVSKVLRRIADARLPLRDAPQKRQRASPHNHPY